MSSPAMSGPSAASGGPAPSLNDAERKVLEGRANGLTYMALAGQLHYTYSSTVNVGSRVIEKMGARDMAHAVFLAARSGLLDVNRRHGDHAGFAAHRYRKEDPCAACWEGERAYRTERRAARKAVKRDAVQGAA